MKYFNLMLIVLLLVSCTKKDKGLPQYGKTPEEVVRQFLELSATAGKMEDKKILELLCTGEMKAAFKEMSEEEFQMSYLKNKLEITNVKFIDVSRKEDTAQISYSVLIKNNQGVDPTVETNQREVDLVNIRGVWHLQNIRPIGKDTIAFTRGMIF